MPIAYRWVVNRVYEGFGWGGFLDFSKKTPQRGRFDLHISWSYYDRIASTFAAAFLAFAAAATS
ncbi:hypothetical protein HNR48_002704 [Pseudoteredinibacter isoporae]|uniref:Uncharacterized protein n=1 Tax=Pseudoteredinibacter isoporae TaxID=570281 RepID=A0A7X0JV82_9GAMM|nr:hypothetical protein [Pseudoteredinibacter isoporae]